MNSPPDAVYAEVRDTDPDMLEAEQLDAYLRRVAELRAFCDAREVRATRAQRRLAKQGRAVDPKSSLSKEGRQSPRTLRPQLSARKCARRCPISKTR